VDKGHGLDADVGRAGRLAEIDVGVEQLAEHEPSARLAAARIRPASATAWSSSKVTAIWSGLWDDRTEQVPSWLGAMVVLSTPFSQVSGHLFAVYRPAQLPDRWIPA
jgi:hypothetical protein